MVLVGGGCLCSGVAFDLVDRSIILSTAHWQLHVAQPPAWHGSRASLSAFDGDAHMRQRQRVGCNVSAMFVSIGDLFLALYLYIGVRQQWTDVYYRL